MKSSRTAAMLAALALIAVAAADTQHCYYPDGTNADQGTSPCNTTATASACCDPRDSCTISGLCLGASGWIYRSACTDKTWQDPACPSQCQIDPILDVTYSSFAPIYPCVAGQYTTKFCCGSTSGPDCCGDNFTIGNTGLAFKPGTDAVEAQLSSLSAALASATASTASVTLATASSSSSPSSSSRGTNIGIAIGAGVGIPLGILALGLLGFLFWRERRRNSLFVDKFTDTSQTQFTEQPRAHQRQQQQDDWKDSISRNGRPVAGVQVPPLGIISHELHS